jgi:6-phosphofructo-2-kinase/fructose-2,6-biphosphatase 4
LEPIIFELERVQEDMLVIGHASVIRCLVSWRSRISQSGQADNQLAYLVGLPPNEVPAVEIARGDLVEVTPASYGVSVQAFHFWYVPSTPFHIFD